MNIETPVGRSDITDKKFPRGWATLKAWAVALSDEFNTQNSGCVISACGAFLVDMRQAGTAEGMQRKRENVEKS